ncbi:hypothetical protein HRbin32_01706 [bacterium HR32]|nr:hypothetical protein HRbin32_01706 [bacterium HR32]
MRDPVLAHRSQQPHRVRADGKEGDKPQVQQARQAHLKVQAQAHQGVQPYEHQNLRHEGSARHGQGCQGRNPHEAPDPPRRPGGQVRPPRRGMQGGAERRRGRTRREQHRRPLRGGPAPADKEPVSDRHETLGLQHEEHQFLEQGEGDHRCRARHQGPDPLAGRAGGRRAQQAQPRTHEYRERPRHLRPVAGGQELEQRRRRVDEHGAQRHLGLEPDQKPDAEPHCGSRNQSRQEASAQRPSALRGSHRSGRRPEDEEQRLACGDHAVHHPPGVQGLHEPCEAQEASHHPEHEPDPPHGYALLPASRSPRIPCGRKISTITSMVKAITSLSW